MSFELDKGNFLVNKGKFHPVDWFEELKKTRKEFEGAYNTKIETEAAINPPLYKIRKTVLQNTAIRYLDYIETNSDWNPAKFSLAKDKINEIITDTVAIARARVTRKENEEKMAVK